MLISVPLLSLVRLLLNLEAAKARGLAEMLRSSTIFIMVEIHGDVYLYITYIYIYENICGNTYRNVWIIGCYWMLANCNGKPRCMGRALGFTTCQNI